MPVKSSQDLMEAAKLSLRVTSDAYAPEVEMLCDAALEDMERVGINADYLASDDAKVRHAVVCYCKAHFGFDNDMAQFFNESYRQHVCDMLNSAENTAASRE